MVSKGVGAPVQRRQNHLLCTTYDPIRSSLRVAVEGQKYLPQGVMTLSLTTNDKDGYEWCSRVAQLACPHYLHSTQAQAHSRLTSAITAPQTPRWRPPAAGDYAAQPLTGTRRAALLGTCARARATRRHDSLNTIATFSFSRRLTLHSQALDKVARCDACAWSGATPPKERSPAHPTHTALPNGP